MSAFRVLVAGVCLVAGLLLADLQAADLQAADSDAVSSYVLAAKDRARGRLSGGFEQVLRAGTRQPARLPAAIVWNSWSTWPICCGRKRA